MSDWTRLERGQGNIVRLRSRLESCVHGRRSQLSGEATRIPLGEAQVLKINETSD
jgi:hypothetical protein